jgi:hypothetical protein
MRRLIIVLIIVSLLALPASATPVAVIGTKLQSKYGILTNVYFETASGPGSSTPNSNTALSPSGTSGSYSIPAGTSGYLWSPQFTSTTTISPGNWVLDSWASATAYSYIPITLINNQSSATPNPYQVMIQANPSKYSALEAPDLGNIEFCSSTTCSTILYSWLEGCGNSAPYGPCSTSSTVATFWVKLTSAINGQTGTKGGTLLVYVVFLPKSTEFDRVHRGEAPQLSSSYGLYDNGANVFDLYFNGTTSLADFNLGANNAVAHTTGLANPVGGSTITVISLTGYGGGNRVNMILTTPLPAGNPTYGEVAESYSEITAGGPPYTADVSGLAGFCGSTTAGSTTMNAESEDVGLGSSLYAYIYDANGQQNIVNGGGTDAATTWYYAALAYPGTASTSFSGIVSTTFYASYATAAGYHPITGSAKLYWCSVGSYSGTYPVGLYFNWGRARAYPPNGVAPSVVPGSLSSNPVTVSIYITSSTGTVTAAVASNVQSSPLGTSESEYGMSFSAPQETVSANGYISVVISASADPCTIYWGVGQPTNFQVPVQVLT